jgi:hypothetical protein
LPSKVILWRLLFRLNSIALNVAIASDTTGFGSAHNDRLMAAYTFPFESLTMMSIPILPAMESKAASKLIFFFFFFCKHHTASNLETINNKRIRGLSLFLDENDEKKNQFLRNSEE